MKNKTIPTFQKKKKDNIILHIDGVKRTIDSMPYIIPASRSGTYSKLERAEKRELLKLKKELKDYTKR